MSGREGRRAVVVFWVLIDRRWEFMFFLFFISDLVLG